jgi:hypothetical protein
VAAQSAVERREGWARRVGGESCVDAVGCLSKPCGDCGWSKMSGVLLGSRPGLPVGAIKYVRENDRPAVV